MRASPGTPNSYERRVGYADESLTPSTYYTYGPQQWPYDDLTYMRPAPPRHPLVAQMVSDIGSNSNPPKKKPESAAIPLMYYSCWRLRWCGLLLLASTTLQSILVGTQLGGDPRSCGGGFAGLLSSGVLLMTVLALWALLSQLLLWSDAAVLRVPQGVSLSADASRGAAKPGGGGGGGSSGSKKDLV